MREEHLSMPLVSADCQFLAPAKHGDRAKCAHGITRFGGKSFVVAHENDAQPTTRRSRRGAKTRVWGRAAPENR